MVGHSSSMEDALRESRGGNEDTGTQQCPEATHSHGGEGKTVLELRPRSVLQDKKTLREMYQDDRSTWCVWEERLRTCPSSCGWYHTLRQASDRCTVEGGPG